ncbi:MAG: hypothetical protein Q9198_002880 [Flavoplaca austrocitrina]
MSADVRQVTGGVISESSVTAHHPSIQQQDTKSGSPEVSPPKVTFFSLPFELRIQVYGYNKPRRIHIVPPDNVKESFNKRTKPWGLMFSSPQARAEVRALFYPSTLIEIYFDCYESALAYQTWIDNLHEGLEASLRHVVLDQFVDINWVPDGPVKKRPTERLEAPSDDDSDAETTIITETEGNWQIRWLKYPLDGDESAIEAKEETLQRILDRTEEPGLVLLGLGENAVRDLAASFVASGLNYWTEGEDEEQYDEDYAGEGDEEYYEGNEEDQEGSNGASRTGQEAIEIPADRAPTPVQDTVVPQ